MWFTALMSATLKRWCGHGVCWWSIVRVISVIRSICFILWYLRNQVLLYLQLWHLVSLILVKVDFNLWNLSHLTRWRLERMWRLMVIIGVCNVLLVLIMHRVCQGAWDLLLLSQVRDYRTWSTRGASWSELSCGQDLIASRFNLLIEKFVVHLFLAISFIKWPLHPLCSFILHAHYVLSENSLLMHCFIRIPYLLILMLLMESLIRSIRQISNRMRR